jgi:hypothetical protein
MRSKIYSDGIGQGKGREAEKKGLAFHGSLGARAKSRQRERRQRG